jgi:hypothetical protein
MKKVLPFVLAIVSSVPAMAGVRYTMYLQSDDSGKHSEVVQNSWLQGSQAKLLFDEGVNSEREVNAERFGTVAYNVDPVTRHSTRIVFNNHVPYAANAPARVRNIVTTKTLQEAGPRLLGHPTTHYRFVSEFDYVENGDTLKGSMIHEVWVANDLADLDLMNWMMFQYRLREDRGIESLFREVSTLGRGLPLAYDGIARIQNGDGNTRIIRLGAQVESLEKVNVDPSVFAASNTYEVVATAIGQ